MELLQKELNEAYTQKTTLSTQVETLTVELAQMKDKTAQTAQILEERITEKESALKISLGEKEKLELWLETAQSSSAKMDALLHKEKERGDSLTDQIATLKREMKEKESQYSKVNEKLALAVSNTETLTSDYEEALAKCQ
eukprot:11691654-Ditylum_brightwellii.AAC.1